MEKGGGQLVDAPSFVDLCTLHQHAMRYYRLWIYACNIVLAVASVIFTLVALSTFVDPRISLISGVELYQPTFLYGYVALFIQCGVLQVIGCIGALRLNQKLLTSYWTLLLVLMIGDILVGLVWAFRLDRIKTNLKPQLKQRLIFQYGNDSQFTQTWDWVQTNDMCCGADGPMDFLRLNDSSSHHFDSNGLPFSDGPQGPHYPKLPSSCCTFTVTHDFPFSTSPHPNSIPSSPLKGSVSSPTSSSSSYPRHTSSRMNGHPHNYFPSSHNFTLHLSSFSSSGATHNRRKIIHGKGKGDPVTQGQGLSPQSPPSQGFHRPNVQTTTESARRSNHFGICGLPPDLLDKYKSSVYVVKISDTIIDNFSFDGGSGGGGGGSSEESSNNYHVAPGSSSTSSPPTATPSSPSILDLLGSGSGGGQPSSTSTPPPSHVLVDMSLHEEGCGEKVLEWVDHASDVLFVIGFCIIVFVKGCFVAILRYEIKEMIQKIKLLNGDDEGRTAAMNELIGLTSMYAGGHEDAEDPAEREGLMASAGGGGGGGGVSGGGGAVANTNIDAIESDRRKESVASRDNCVVGNNVGHSRKMSVANHVVSSAPPCNNPTRTVVVGVSSHNTKPLSPLVPLEQNVPQHLHHQNDIEDDFDSGSALLGKPRGGGGGVSSGGVSGAKSQHRNENGGRSLPRNGNNNTTGLGGVTGSASAPIPIDSMAKA